MAGLADALLAMGFAQGQVDAAVQRHKALNDALDWLFAAGGRSTRGQDKDAAAQPAAVAVDLTAAGSSSSATGASSSSRSPKRPRPAEDTAATPAATAADGRATSSSGTAAASSSSASSPKRPRPAQDAAASSSSSTPQRRRLRKGPPQPSYEELGPQEPEFNRQEDTCGICTETLPPWSGVRLPCRHGWYCPGCLQRFANARLSDGRHEVPCPECGVPLGQALLRAVLPQQTMDRLLERSLEQAVSASEGLWPCPTPDCPHRVALEEGEVPCLSCPQCEKESCLRCHAAPYHHGLTCDEHAAARRASRQGRAGRGSGAAPEQQDDDSESLLQKWMKKTGSKQCPRCKMGVTKEDLVRQRSQKAECHKMICRNCSTRFCFKCLTVLTSSSSCGCTPDEHGFINPRTGRYVQHLSRGARAAA